ncbi:aspartic peptidase domain-containing protein [Cristinia sonorae]|uniref:Aspartic peptidase domain-containing protein n=1 Tax=Cristinia sonorae TaxID=1940300 RepID=A0A8K0UFX1_9AGAR|nr:aspartic peptidase domain-containing protein [Cristinia sonorae]
MSNRNGRQRAYPLNPRQDTPNAAGGQVVPMKLVGSSLYEAIYTVPLTIGPDKQNISVQVDSGSSDLWIAANSCTQSSCSGTNRKYDPSKATPTGQDFSIQYVEGTVSGPIMWDSVQLGGYQIDNQALAAANRVDDEPLSADFSGILGLALPLNSYISEQIPPTVGNQADGAAFTSNLFGTTPAQDAPAARFLSLSLERPGSSKIPSYLGIGKHPPDIISDPSKIEYAPLVNEPSGAYFWKSNVKAVTVYQDGLKKPIAVKSGNGAAFATAVVDSGMPIILASLDIANGIYGALGIGPASDRQYYVPCDLPMNLTITLDDRAEIPLHPLDLTTTALGSSNSHPTCMGIIQSFQPGSTVGQLADIVLGVPFMRSTYTVMAYDPPDSHGGFPNAGNMPASAAYIRPRLGLLGLTDPTTALNEFHAVRVLNQPLDQNGRQNAGQAGVPPPHPNGPKKLSVGIIVLISLVGFVALCVAFFGARWAFGRRKYRPAPGTHEQDSQGDSKDDVLLQEVAYRLARRSSMSNPYGPSEDTLRKARFEEYKRRTTYTDDTERTRVHVELDDDAGKRKTIALDDDYQELGYIPSKFRDSDATFGRSPDAEAFDRQSLLPLRNSIFSDTEQPPRSQTMSSIPNDRGHNRLSSVAVPLLGHSRSESSVSRIDDDTRRSRRSMSPRGPRPAMRSHQPGSMDSTNSGPLSPLSQSTIPVETSDIASPQQTRPSSPSPLVAPLPPPPPSHSQSLLDISDAVNGDHGYGIAR